MSSLYELVTDFKELSELDFDDIDIEKAEEIKEVIKAEIETKGTNIISLIRNIEGDVLVIEKEIERLSKLKKSKENKIKSIKNYTLDCLQELEMKKVETCLGNISIRNNTPSVVIEDENLLQDRFKEKIETYKVDKNAIKKAINNGEQIIGAHLEVNKSLQIK